MTLEELKEFLSNLTVVEACKLAIDLEDAWGVVGVGRRGPWRGVSMAYGAPLPPSYYLAERPYRVILTDLGPNYLHVLKVLRAYLGWSLIQIKEVLQKSEVDLYYGEERPTLNDLTYGRLPIIKELEDLGAKVKTLKANDDEL